MIDVKKLAEKAGALADKEIQKPGYPSEKWQEYRDRHLAALVLAEALQACIAVRTLAEFQSWDHGGIYAEEIKGSQDCVLVIDQIIDMVLGQDGDFRMARAVGKLMPAKDSYRIRELAEMCAEWHMGDNDECGEIARELLTLLEPAKEQKT